MQSHSINKIRRCADVRPALTTDSADIHLITAQARAERNLFISKMIAGAVRSMVSGIEGAMARRRAVGQLSAMSDRELSDIGLARGEIRAAVYAGSPDAQPVPLGMFAAIRRFLAGQRQKHTNYLDLFSLDDHLLQDIGVARSEISGFTRGESLQSHAAANWNKPRSVA